MTKVGIKLDAHSKAKRKMLPHPALIDQLSQKAIQKFAELDSINIVEDDEGQFKIVRLFDKDQNPIYFLVLQKLGAGAFGEVSQGIQLDIKNSKVIPDAEVAIKITDYSAGGTLGKRDIDIAREEAEHEYDILYQLQQSKGFSLGQRTKNVILKPEAGVTINGVATVQEAVIAMSLRPGKDIQAHKDKYSYGSITFVQLTSALCINLQLLHDKNIIHSDLKPANVIWEPGMAQANIVDFNRAKFISDETYVYTDASSDRAYMAADCFTGREYRFSKASDVYSLGKILVEKFYIDYGNGQKESLTNKYHLSYDQLMIKHFLEQMTAVNEFQRPTLQDCTQFFKQLENKMQLDLKQPKNKMRLELSKKIISLEVYANQLRDEIASQSQFDMWLTGTGLTADKRKKYEDAIQAIGLLSQALSTPKIDRELLKHHAQELKQMDAYASGLFSFKGRFNQIIDEVGQSLADADKINTNTINLVM
ncbi:protein kinase [Legionella lytica]|uniref:Protein kinase n=1 Tax=Legionella lytica TaxID=96232 RepID=A0ABW8D4D0_9GAMM